MRRLSGGLFLVTLSTVMFEVLLTRIFSLTMWYHFAFMAISMAMLGMTVGALFVFLRPLAWPEVTLLAGMGRSALLFAVSMVVVILLHTRAMALGGQRRSVGACLGAGGGHRHGGRDFQRFLGRGSELSRRRRRFCPCGATAVA